MKKPCSLTRLVRYSLFITHINGLWVQILVINFNSYLELLKFSCSFFAYTSNWISADKSLKVRPIMNYINPLLSCFRVIFSFSIGLLFFLMWNQIESHADLIDEGKTDSAVKMLHFPKSLRVIENITAGLSGLHRVFNDPKQIRRTLLKVDPARIVPAKSGVSLVGEITREKLK